MLCLHKHFIFAIFHRFFIHLFYFCVVQIKYTQVTVELQSTFFKKTKAPMQMEAFYHKKSFLALFPFSVGWSHAGHGATEAYIIGCFVLV